MSQLKTKPASAAGTLSTYDKDDLQYNTNMSNLLIMMNIFRQKVKTKEATITGDKIISWRQMVVLFSITAAENVSDSSDKPLPQQQPDSLFLKRRGSCRYGL